MRAPLFSANTHFLKYQIREIVEVGKHLQKIDPSLNVVWENIGDPIAQGWNVPDFLKELLREELARPQDTSFGYVHSRGQLATREWLTTHLQRLCPFSRLSPDDILFTNGLGAAIGLIYQMVPTGTRVLQPAPGYPPHISLESFYAGQEPLFYPLQPEKNWEPDLSKMEKMLQTHPEIGAILVINPNNPTGAVLRHTILTSIVALAKKYQVVIIADQIYARLVFHEQNFVDMVELADNRVPLIVMRGISKDVPWPGSRCGWLEFHNTHLDQDFQKFTNSIKQRALLEVCSTALPQIMLPKIYSHPDFLPWLQHYISELESIAAEIGTALHSIPSLHTNPTHGAFYMLPQFKENTLTNKQTLPIAHSGTREYIENTVNKPDFPLDQRFCYYLLAATGICVVPASGFYSPFPGFRITTLDRNAERRQDTYARLKTAIGEYLAS